MSRYQELENNLKLLNLKCFAACLPGVFDDQKKRQISLVDALYELSYQDQQRIER
ncbi:hypothetical protein [Xylocopilactobacillus apicola]|uniref:Uncharacterized protein n=1 Tax=Xylocopilactobacillus apicola TaxID=2932184 RepID=A0AAU9DDN3_9LACO|nr:hypothetical protein [Xylocopilactobacillus apicola]BDR59710.1 hypothetical protein XA3_21510 [Xylocopilactobacillus apicola]